MQTAAELKAFHAAFDAWRARREHFEDRMRVAAADGPYDYEAAMIEAAELRRLLAEFVVASQPFVRQEPRH